jgi:predicted metal-dependent phosphoesterase TrpH
MKGKSLGLKLDLHVHTCYSHDAVTTLKQVVDYSRKRGLDGVAITDHNTVKGALKLKTRDIIVVPGIEVSTLNGHLLGLNVTTPIPAKLGIEETIRLIHEAGGIAVAPHPTTFYKSPPSRRVSSYDAVEVMNGASAPFPVFTYLSKKFASGLGLPQTGGSDSHYAPEIGAAYTVVDADPDVDEIVCAIKKGAAYPVGQGIPLRIRLGRTALKLKGKL